MALLWDTVLCSEEVCLLLHIRAAAKFELLFHANNATIRIMVQPHCMQPDWRQLSMLRYLRCGSSWQCDERAWQFKTFKHQAAASPFLVWAYILTGVFQQGAVVPVDIGNMLCLLNYSETSDDIKFGFFKCKYRAYTVYLGHFTDYLMDHRDIYIYISVQGQ